MQLNRITAKSLIGIVKQIKTLWNNELVPILNSLNLTAGKGIRIQKMPAGTIISNIGVASIPKTPDNSSYSTAFKVQYNPESKMLDIGVGYANCNGIVETIAPTSIVVKDGLLCLIADKKDTIWQFKIDYRDKFDEYSYPIAKITKQDDDIIIQQYPVTVAIMLVSKICPLTKM